MIAREGVRPDPGGGAGHDERAGAFGHDHRLLLLAWAVPASALATYVHRVLTCGGDAPTLDLSGQVEWREERWLSRCGRGGW